MRRVILLCVLGILCLPHLVFAADYSYQNMLDFSPPDTDQSVQYLAALFGVVGNVLHGVGSQVMAVMFKVFNSAVLALGGLIVSYTLFVSTLNTAHEGEVMGKKWSSIWIPVRSAMGVALLLPKTTGYSFIQVFIMWLVIQGVGMADSIWNAAIDYFSKGGVIIQSSFQPSISAESAAKESLQGLMAAEVCMYALQNALEAKYSDGSVSVPLLSYTLDFSKLDVPGSTPSASQTMKIPSIDATLYPELKAFDGACGEITWTPMADKEKNPYGRDTTISSAPRTIALQQMLMNVDAAAASVVNNSTLEPNLRVGLGRCPTNGNCNQSTWSGDGNGSSALLDGSLLQTMYADYTGIISPSLRAAAGRGAEKWMSKAKEQGWLMAGTYYYNLAALNNDASVMADNAFPTIKFTAISSGPSQEKKKSSQLRADKDNFCKKTPFSSLEAENCGKFYDVMVDDNLTLFLNDSFKYRVANTESVSEHNNRIQDTQSAFRSARITASAFSFLMGPLISSMVQLAIAMAELTKAEQSNSNPLLILARMGYELINMATALWITGIALVVLAGATGAIPSVTLSTMATTAATWLVPFLTVIMTLMFSTGAVLGYYVPLIPFIIFTFASLGWFIGVIEAMVAAPIVALGVLHPDGQHEVWGKAEQGVMLLLNVFLRPGMMIIGLISGISLSYIGVWILNKGFGAALDVVNPFNIGGAGIGLIWWPLIIAVVYAGLAVAIVSKAFTLIHIIPDKILRWLSGGMAESLGAESAGAADSIKSGVSATGQSVGSGMSSSLSSGAQDMKGKAASKGADAKVEGQKPGGGNQNTATNAKQQSPQTSGSTTAQGTGGGGGKPAGGKKPRANNSFP